MSTALTSTTLSAALTNQANVLNVASATGITAPTNNIFQQLYVINPETTKGELMDVVAVSGTAIQVARNQLFRQAFLSGAYVVIGQSPTKQAQGFGSFFETDPVGSVTAANVSVAPYINVTNGNQWLRSLDGLWVPGFNNPSPNKGVTTAVASAASAVLPTGPLFHITGTAGITGFTLPVGFSGGSFSCIPDGTFTWTTDSNIALAGTAVVSRVLTFTWSSQDSKWFPSYV